MVDGVGRWSRPGELVGSSEVVTVEGMTHKSGGESRDDDGGGDRLCR